MTVSMGISALVAALEEELRSVGTPERSVQEKAYLKSELDHYGVTVPAVRKIAKGFSKREGAIDHDELVRLISALWHSTVYERRAIAVELLEQHQQLLSAADLDLLEDMLRDSHTWALVDNLAATIVGGLVTRYPVLNKRLDRWAHDDDFWIRRSAMLALLGPLRDGHGDFERFTRYADTMLEDKEFFIRKAIGWVLRETSKKRPGLVTEWMLPRAKQVSGVTFREVIRRLPAEQRDQLLAARND